MRRRRAVQVSVKSPDRGLITRGPSNINEEERARSWDQASNVRFADGVVSNAPRYERLVTCGALDSPVHLIFQGNVVAANATGRGKPVFAFTKGKVYHVRTSSRSLDCALPLVIPADCDTPTSTGAGNVSFTSATYSVAESAGQVLVYVTRSGGTNGIVGVTLTTSDGTGADGVDYTALTAATGALTWSHGEQGTKSVSIPILDNDISTADLTFTVNLTLPLNGLVLGGVTTTTVTISDDD